MLHGARPPTAGSQLPNRPAKFPISGGSYKKKKEVNLTLLSLVCERAGVLTSVAVAGVAEDDVEKVLFGSGIDIAAGWGAAAGVGADALNVLVGWMV